MTIVGTVLGKYRILSELSRGGMGEVYRAQHEILGRSAAIKVLRPELTENETLVLRFINEAKAASGIRHPGIIEVLDFGTTEDGRSYLVMEFLEGEPLATRMQKRGKLSDDEVAAIGRGIAGALTAAHGKGIVHRDLKPDNVFMVPDIDMPSGERPKVLDFGIAKLADAGSLHTQTGALMGTPAYMAPEQARAAADIDHRADLYSLGCILYELAVGEPPFVGAGAGELVAMHMFQQPVRPRDRVPSVSPVLDGIIMRLLAKEPAQRYQSAAEVAEALTLKHPASSAAFTIPAVVAQPAAKSRLPVVAGALTLVIAGGLIALFVMRGRGDKPVSPAGPAPAARTSPAPLPSPTPLAPAPVPAPQVPVPAPIVDTPAGKPAKTTVHPVTPPTQKAGSDDHHIRNKFPIEPSI